MEVSPGEVHDLSKEGLSVSEIARRLKISRALVNLKLREYELDKREYELDNRRRELDIEEADLEARKKVMDKIPDLEEKAHSLKSMVDTLTKEKDELEREKRSNMKVVEEIKDFKKRKIQASNQLSELSNRLDLHRRSHKKLDDTLNQKQTQLETESLSLLRIKNTLDKNRKENMRLVVENKQLDDANKYLEHDNSLKKEAINEIAQSYYGFISLTKQIALFMPGGSDTKTKTHEHIRNKVLQGMEIIAEKANITKPPSDSDFQALLRDPSILKCLYSSTSSHETSKE